MCATIQKTCEEIFPHPLWASSFALLTSRHTRRLLLLFLELSTGSSTNLHKNLLVCYNGCRCRGWKRRAIPLAFSVQRLWFPHRSNPSLACGLPPRGGTATPLYGEWRWLFAIVIAKESSHLNVGVFASVLSIRAVPVGARNRLWRSRWRLPRSVVGWRLTEESLLVRNR